MPHRIVGRPGRQRKTQSAEPGLPTMPTRKLERSSGTSRHMVKVPEGFELVNFTDFNTYAYQSKGKDFDMYLCNSTACVKRTDPNLYNPTTINGEIYRIQSNMDTLSVYLSGSQLEAVKKLREERKKQENDNKKEDEKKKKNFMNTVSKRTKITEKEYIEYVRGTNQDNGWTKVTEEEPSSYYRGDPDIVVYYIKDKRGGGRGRSRGFMASLKKVFGMTRRVRRS
jgi:hypothetical protein